MKLLFALALLFAHCFSFAQDNVQSGLLPEVALSFSIGENWQATGKVESMQALYNDGNEEAWSYEYIRTDLQGFIGYSINPFWSLAAGYQYRFQDGADEHRIIQQVSYVQRYIGYRLGHRGRTDQTFSSSAGTEYRLRYRLSGEFPLAGLSIDAGEYYVIVSDELVYSLQNGAGDDLENRVGLALGHYFGRKSKLEAGLDYRLEQLLTEGLKNELWLELGWFYNW